MKASELMINDLVMFNGEVYKIHGVYGNAQMVDISPCYLKDKEGLYLLPIVKHVSLINPIILTEEILKANGWSYDDINETWTHKFCPLELFNPWNINEGYVLSCYNSITFAYVHELQHAYRLCGLNDLADNLKVESLK